METFDPKMKKLLLDRLEIRKEQGRLAGVFRLGPGGQGRHYTPEEIIQEAKRGTPVGEDFLISEKKLMDEIKKRM